MKNNGRSFLEIPVNGRDPNTFIEALKANLLAAQLPPKLMGKKQSRFREHLEEDELDELEELHYLTSPEDAAKIRNHLLRLHRDVSPHRSRSPQLSPWKVIRRMSRSNRRVASDGSKNDNPPIPALGGRHSEDFTANSVARRSNRGVLVWEHDRGRPNGPPRSFSANQALKANGNPVSNWMDRAISPDGMSFRKWRREMEEEDAEAEQDREGGGRSSPEEDATFTSGGLRAASSFFTDSSMHESSILGEANASSSTTASGHLSHKRDLSRISETLSIGSPELHVPQATVLELLGRSRIMSCPGAEDLGKKGGRANTDFVIGRSNSRILSKPRVTKIHFPSSDSDPSLPLPDPSPTDDIPDSRPPRLRSMSTPAPSLLTRLRPQGQLTPPAPPPPTPSRYDEADGRPLLPLAARDLWDRNFSPEDAAKIRNHLLRLHRDVSPHRSRSPQLSPWKVIRRMSRSNRRVASDGSKNDNPPIPALGGRHSEDFTANSVARRSNRGVLVWEHDRGRPNGPPRSFSANQALKANGNPVSNWMDRAISPDGMSFRKWRREMEEEDAEAEQDREGGGRSSPEEDATFTSGGLRAASSFFTDSSMHESSILGEANGSSSTTASGHLSHKRDLSRISETLSIGSPELHVPQATVLELLGRSRIMSCPGAEDLGKKGGRANTDFVIGRSNSRILSKPRVTKIHFPSSDSDPSLPLPNPSPTDDIPDSRPPRLRSMSTPAPSLLTRLRPQGQLTPPAPPPPTPSRYDEADGRPLLPLAARDLWDRNFNSAQPRPLWANVHGHRRAETKVDMLILSPDSRHLKNYFGNSDKKYLEVDLEPSGVGRHSPTGFQGGWGKAGVDKFLEKNGYLDG
ncbi:hypothetical protein BT69DRAFT_1341140 [Atractiella rhizophila]|nr:hypothetical protein BT69DRAFT_1341140 [Atractiella rhizophila]